ncbi:unnamed protein product [Schistocephalus solidus]|uniref:SURP motif domain-containing protein n=1 Tax=Schistocephalus solidus TaxID=70667 RepID=A0A183SRG9_SCHSO|nr:unnamed protein product [Schistocephalus solidus]
MLPVQDVALEKLQVTGYKCTLFDDPEKYLDINLGSLLVPVLSDPSLLIDRYDCRGYLQDLSDYDADNVIRRSNLQTEEDTALEELCDYERYLELQVDVHEVAILQGESVLLCITTSDKRARLRGKASPYFCVPEEEVKREGEAVRSSYAAVDFSYQAKDTSSPRELGTDEPKSAAQIPSSGSDSIPTKPEESDNDMTSAAKAPDNAPYVCPPELVLPPYMVLPQSDRQAAIIERTAVFIARNSTQMEIVLKAKQASNSQFQFLNYDSELNPFYKELVKLIKAGRYFPKIRQLPETNSFGGDGQTDPLNSMPADEPYQLKLPKVDISNTAYASLINRFKKSNEDKLAASSPTSAAAESPKDTSSPASHSHSGEEFHNSTSGHDEPVLAAKPSSEGNDLAASSKSNTVTNGFSALDYEQCYQNYYKHYYAYYYIQLARSRVGSKKLTSDLSPDESTSLVQEAAKAAATAASSAVNAIHQSSNSPSVEQRVIIDKMAEYVARNGDEFEEIVKNQKKGDPRLAFLRPGHLFHAYYQSKKAEIMASRTIKSPNKQSSTEKSAVGSPKNGQASTVTKPTIDSSSSKKTSTAAISFRLSKSASSGRLKGLAGESESLTRAADSNSSSCEPKIDRPMSPNIRLSGSCSLLPGMNSYSSDSEGEESPPPSPVTLPIRAESKETAVEMTEPSNGIPTNPTLVPSSITVFGPLPMAQAPPQAQSTIIALPRVEDQSLLKMPATPIIQNFTERSCRSPSRLTEPIPEAKVPTPPPGAQGAASTVFDGVSSTLAAAAPHLTESSRVDSSKNTCPPTVLAPLVETTTTAAVTSSPQRVFTPSDDLALLTREFSTEDSPEADKDKLSGESVDRLGCTPSPPAPAVSATELARLQRERRQRAALLVARIKRDRESQPEPTVKVPISGSASPPPPPQSVPNAVARDVIAQLRLQRERALAAQAEEEAKARKKVIMSICFSLRAPGLIISLSLQNVWQIFSPK